MTDLEFTELLDKYLAGKANGRDKEVLQQVYAQLEQKYGADHLDVREFAELEEKLVRRFTETIQPQQEIETKPQSRLLSLQNLIRIAAVLFISLAVSWYFISGPILEKPSTSIQLNHPVTYRNTSGTTKKLIFPDQSFVLLEPGSSIAYERNFEGKTRMVNLLGEGFFQVTKNHTKAFIVYTPRVVAKVLGTSFIVKSGTSSQQASVTVRTGKVSVYKTAQFSGKDTAPKLDQGLIILPNHVANLNKAEILEKTLVSAPIPIKGENDISFNFNDTPVEMVFLQLQNAYGINIKYDKVKLKACTITVSLGKEDFYQKLNLICRTINSTYIIKNGEIILSGNGC